MGDTVLTVYVLYADFGQFEGCSAPAGAVLTAAEAAAWVAKEPEFNCYAEFELAETNGGSEQALSQ
jgi:hypothetical protein